MHSAYLYVFNEDIDKFHLAFGIVFAALFFLVLAGFFMVQIWGPRTVQRRIAFGAQILGVVGLLIANVAYAVAKMGSDAPKTVQTANMDANLKQKYDATLAPPLQDSYSDAYLTQPNKYELALPDGKTGTYLIKWDKDTNEPTILDDPAIPTPEQMNQNANKH